MGYYLCYKGKILSEAMTKEKAKAKLIQLRYCFKGLHIKKTKKDRS